MNSICKTTLAFSVLLCALTKKSTAQYNTTPSPYEFGISAGTFIYQGDLASSRIGYTNILKPTIGFHLSRKFDSYFSLRGNLTFGKLKVEEARQTSPAYHQTRNFKFSTPVTEVSALLIWNIPGEESHKLTYYLMGGVGAAFTNVRRDWSGTDTSSFSSHTSFAEGLGADTLHRTPRVVAALPLGAGLRYQISSAWSVNLESLLRFTPSDYLDGFSRSVNAKTKDRYYGISLGVSYRFGTDKFKCPPVN